MPRPETVGLSIEEALSLCEAAAANVGARPETARSIARACVAAEADGQGALGLSHFLDFLDALRAARLDGNAWPEISRPAPALFLSDAKGGSAHLGFDLAFDDLAKAAREFGVALFSQKNAFTCGALGYFVDRLARAGLVALAATNGPALMAGSGSTRPVFCTNPLAFAAPRADGPPLLIDQSSSATAFVNIRRAAQAGDAIPAGWALDAQGRPTLDAREALRGVLLAAGGARGANIALMVEVLAAGVSGANWSLDAPPFDAGAASPGSGLFVLALAPALLDPHFETRMAAQLDRLANEYGVHVPGESKAAARKRSRLEGLRVDRSVVDAIRGIQAR